MHDVQSAIGVQTRAPQTAVWGSVLHQPGHLLRHRQVETPSVAQRKAWLEDERHSGLVRLTRTDLRDPTNSCRSTPLLLMLLPSLLPVLLALLATAVRGDEDVELRVVRTRDVQC